MDLIGKFDAILEGKERSTHRLRTEENNCSADFRMQTQSYQVESQ